MEGGKNCENWCIRARKPSVPLDLQKVVVRCKGLV